MHAPPVSLMHLKCLLYPGTRTLCRSQRCAKRKNTTSRGARVQTTPVNNMWLDLYCGKVSMLMTVKGKVNNTSITVYEDTKVALHI